MRNETPSSGDGPDPVELATARVGFLLLRVSRVVTGVGVVALLFAAWGLILVATVETVRHLGMIAALDPGRPATQATVLASIKLVDLMLIATVLQVAAFGLYSLLVDPDLPLPRWLRTDDPEELKRKLAGIIVIMLGVLFLEEVIEWRSGRDLLPFGIAIAAVIATLSFFARVKGETKG